MRIAIIGSGISGLAAAWLLSRDHEVTVYEKDAHPGGHANTVTVADPEVGRIAVDTGFIVYNEVNYPNLVALFDHLGVATLPTDMSFAVSADDGGFEYAGRGPGGLLAQRRNLFRPRLWRMAGDVLRFYRNAPRVLDRPDAETLTLGDLLREGGYGAAFVNDHILPMGAAIWSTPTDRMLDHPAASLVRFMANHGLLKLRGRPQWRTVRGGSREYVARISAPFADRVRLETAVTAVTRLPDRVRVDDCRGGGETFDQVVFASHADQTLALLADPEDAERQVLGAFSYQPNRAVLHADARLMPRTRRAWASWNYLSRRRPADGDAGPGLCVTYWMNALQSLRSRDPLLVTLNPPTPPDPGTVFGTFDYRHPVFDAAAGRMRARMWSLQGHRRTWYCGAYLGDGFHEDGLQAGLAVAEALGGARRPWTVADESGRLHLPATWGGATGTA